MSTVILEEAGPSRRVRHGSRPALAAGVALVVLVAVYLGYAISTPYHLDIAMTFTMYALLALGMYVPLFLGGSIDLAYNAYLAAGAYSVAIIGVRTDLPGLVAIPIGALVAAAIALLLGLATSHLTGFHLALTTMLAGYAVYRWISSTGADITGGANGLGGIPRLEVLGVELDRELLVAVGFAIVWLVAVGLSQFRRSLPGLAIRLNRATPAAARAAGSPTKAMQLLSLMLGAAIASLGGALIALMNQFILADSFSHDVVFLVLFLPLLGGIGTPWGAVAGAALLCLLNEASSFLDGPGPLVFGGASLLILILLPGGLAGLLAAAWSLARNRRATADA